MSEAIGKDDAAVIITSDDPEPLTHSTFIESNPNSGEIMKEVKLSDGRIFTTTIQVPGELGLGSHPEQVEIYDKSWLLSEEIPIYPSSGRRFKICDLFSGCGGLSLGVEDACRTVGFEVEHVFALDILEGAERVYRKNFSPDIFHRGPIEEIINGQIGEEFTESELNLKRELGKIHMVVGGPPCQGHSALNNHSRRKREGKKRMGHEGFSGDDKNQLYLRMVRFVEIIMPEIVIIENVTEVVHSKGKLVDKTMAWLSNLGYGVGSGNIRAVDVGVPQNRRRHFTIGILGKDFNFKESIVPKRKDAPRNVMWAIEDLIDRKGEATFDTPANHKIQNRERIAWLFGENWSEEEVIEFNKSGDSDNPEAWELPNHRRPPCHQVKNTYPAVYGRMYANLPAPTITTGFGSTGQGRFVHPHRKRSLTPHEAARVQTFPDFFDFSSENGRVSLQTLIGNAVPPFLSAHIALQAILINGA